MDFDVTGKSPGDDIVLHKLANWLFCSTHSTTADRGEDLKRSVFGKNK